MTIRVDRVDDMPSWMIQELRTYIPQLMGSEYVEQLLEYDEMLKIAENLNAICLKEGIIGYHYTRAVITEIRENGLMITLGQERRRHFLNTYGSLFTDEQVSRIIDSWDSYFKPFDNQVRDGKVWFNFTLSAMGNGGAKLLLEFYGGESIYMPLTREVDIAKIIKSLGDPLVVECKLDANKLKTFSEVPWGKVWLSSYHRSVNPNALQCDHDGYVQESVHPTSIVQIHAIPK